MNKPMGDMRPIAELNVVRKEDLLLLGMQLLVSIPFFQLMQLPLFLVVLAVGLLAFWSAGFMGSRARSFMAVCLAASGGAFLLWKFGWQEISAIAVFFFVIGWSKLAEIKHRKDRRFQVLLIFLQIVFALLLAPLFTTFLVALICLLSGFVILGSDVNTSLRKQLISGGTVVLIALPLAIPLFLFFPRMNANLFDIGMIMGLPGALQLSAGETIPLNDSVGFDDIANKSNSDTRVLIANFHEGIDPFFNGIPPLEKLYWKGPVLWTYEDNKWAPREGWNKRSNRMKGRMREEDIDRIYESTDKLTAYSVALFPSNSYWTYALDLPARSAASTYVTRDMQLLNLNPVRHIVKYHMTSFLGYRQRGELLEEDRQLALQVPKDRDPKLKSLALELVKEASQPEDFVNRVLRVFYEGYHYNPSQRSNGKRDAMDHFLFEEKVGNSAHYASAYALMMRHGGIPTRLVAGYRGGNVVGLTEMVLILENSAYVWAESWIEGRGWVRVDPAMPVAGPPGTGSGGWGLGGDVPSKESEIKAQKQQSPKPVPQKDTAEGKQKEQETLPQSDTSRTEDEREAGWYETLQSDWVSWITGYNAQVQQETIKGTHSKSGKANWQELLLLLLGSAVSVLVILFAGLVLLRWYKGRPRYTDRLKREYTRFSEVLARKGGPLPLSENADLVLQQFQTDEVISQQAYKTASIFLQTYSNFRYGKPSDEAITQQIVQLKKLRKEFQKQV